MNDSLRIFLALPFVFVAAILLKIVQLITGRYIQITSENYHER